MQPTRCKIVPRNLRTPSVPGGILLRMLSIRALRAKPFYADMFARVHVLCWPILWWQLKRLFDWYHREGITGGFFSVSRWGIVTVHYVDDKIDPATYRPRPRTFRPLTDPGFASDLPANLATREILTAAPILPRAAGGGVSPLCRLTKEALLSPPNTS